MKSIQYILFDAANTVIHKPTLWIAMVSVLEKHGYSVPVDKLRVHHKLISEVVNFPDRTSREFYHNFNAEFVLSLGILPTEEMLKDLFSACSYLPWERFDDTAWFSNCPVPLGVLSNFNNTLPNILTSLFGNVFSNILVSESMDVRKPDAAFFQHALDTIGLPPSQILYVGDSLKLDMQPAKRIGFTAYLIDRLSIYTEFKNKLSTLSELKSII